MEIKQVFGTHSAFYYTSFTHLYVNLFYYIQEGMNNKERIYISMCPTAYKDLMRLLEDRGFDSTNIEFKPVKRLIEGYKSEGLGGLKGIIRRDVSEALKSGYTGIRYIGQPSFAIYDTSEQDFLDWEESLDKAFEDEKASLLCIYDFDDYLNEGERMNDKVIKRSVQTHSHVLYNLTLHDMAELRA